MGNQIHSAHAFKWKDLYLTSINGLNQKSAEQFFYKTGPWHVAIFGSFLSSEVRITNGSAFRGLKLQFQRPQDFINFRETKNFQPQSSTLDESVCECVWVGVQVCACVVCVCLCAYVEVLAWVCVRVGECTRMCLLMFV